jgi:hypothetical protein
MSNDILKAYFRTKGFALDDDGSLRQGGRLVATNVRVTEDGADCIRFACDTAPGVGCLMEDEASQRPLGATLH